MHLTSGELVGIIINNSYWPYFKSYFTANKSVVTLKLQEIGNVRNTLAHFRPIAPGDVEVVKQNAQQVLPVVEKMVTNVTNCVDNVPTNTPDDWYEALKSLTSGHVKFAFSQSIGGEWIRITLMHHLGFLSKTPDRPSSWVQYRLTNLNAVSILNKYDKLRDPVLFMTEYVPYIGMPPNFIPKFEKRLRFTFNKKMILENYVSIKEEFDLLLAQIEYEMDLLKGDQPARGELLSVIGVTARKIAENETSPPYWSITRDPIITPTGNDNPIEYWGHIVLPQDNFISNTEAYPWMPVDISKENLFF